ncbi:NAD(P)H-dependent oxidoreductase [Streptomyces sp. NPDC092370]|uniref:NAD(P)H-dependent oxidoreductase n=1 Tax=Streptomyces sp. NPDC092370 TaxID=3366016 RepID=UPI00382ABDDC
MRAPAQGSRASPVETDLLVPSFPMEWFSLPAVLKGRGDRVFVRGGVFGGAHRLSGEAALAGRRAMLLFTTGQSGESLRPGGAFGPMDDFLFPIHRGMLEFVGFEVLDPVINHGPARMTDQERTAALEAVGQAVGRATRKPIAVPLSG